MQSEEAVVQKSFLCYLAHPVLSFLGDLKWTGRSPGHLLLGWGFAEKPACGLLLWGGGGEPSSLALAVCWHLLPARGAMLKCKEMQGLRSLLNSRKAACWAGEVRKECSFSCKSKMVSFLAWPQRKRALRQGACTGVLQAFLPDLKNLLSAVRDV